MNKPEPKPEYYRRRHAEVVAWAAGKPLNTIIESVDAKAAQLPTELPEEPPPASGEHKYWAAKRDLLVAYHRDARAARGRRRFMLAVSAGRMLQFGYDGNRITGILATGLGEGGET